MKNSFNNHLKNILGVSLLRLSFVVSGFPFQSFCSFLTKRIFSSIPNAKLIRLN